MSNATKDPRRFKYGGQSTVADPALRRGEDEKARSFVVLKGVLQRDLDFY